MAGGSRKRRKRRRSPRRAASVPSRRGRAAPAGGGSAGSPPARRAGRSAADGRPPAPWGSFPLVELTVLVGIVLLVVGFLAGGERGTVTIVVGLVLASLGGLELSVREHFAGFRSHTLVLAGVPAAIVLGLLFYLGPEGLSPQARVAAGLTVFAGAALLLQRIFRERSGGRAFKLR